MFKVSSLLLSFFALLFLGGCFPLQTAETIVLNPNGTGNALFYLKSPGAKPLGQNPTVQAQKLLTLAQDTSGISSGDIYEVSPQGITLALEFTQAYALKNFLDKAQAEGFIQEKHLVFNDWDWHFISFLEVELTRTVPYQYKDGKRHYASSMQFTYTLPEASKKHNAHNQIDKTLIWRFTQKELEESPNLPVLSFSLAPWYLVPQNTLIGVLGGLSGACIAGLYILIRKIFFKKKSPKKKTRASKTPRKKA